jgi:4-amino-4-deoxy-L-arabinose transferase-like glycosyltransferase
MPQPTGRGPSPRDRYLYLILLLALGLRAYHLAYPPWDYDNWRQAQTLVLARDFARHGFHLLYPQVPWVSQGNPSAPNYYCGEFSIESAVAALLYKAFGESDTAARLVVITFSLLGIYFLYTLLERRAGREAACLGALVYALLPYHIFFGRVFMPDIPALALALGGLSALDRWTDDRKWKTLVLAAILTSLALLQKLTVAFIGLPALYLFWLALGRRLFSRLEPYAFAAVAGLPTLAWYAHAAMLGRASGYSILPSGEMGRHLGLWFDLSFARRIFLQYLTNEAFSPIGLALAIGGFVWPGHSRLAWVFRLWVVGAGLVLFLFPRVVAENPYYLLLLLPGGAALAGLSLASLLSDRRSYRLMAVLLGFLVTDAICVALPFYQPDRNLHDLGLLLQRLTAPQELIVVESDWKQNVIYFADRRGWILRDYDIGLVSRLAGLGGRYYADVTARDRVGRRSFLQAMDSRFVRLTPDDAPWPIYSLAPSTDLLHDVPPGEIENPLPVNYGGQIELLGTTIRELLEWPASIQVSYYWQCLKKINMNLEVFVHFTSAEGKIIFRHDHWPLEGRLPTPQWNVGDIVRERYILVFPGNISPGHYQVRVGWFDPVQGPRLPIISSPASDEQARAIVAEIEISRTPKYSWFRVHY